MMYVRGSSMVYALMVSTIVFAMLSGYILLNSQLHLRLNRLYFQERAEANLQSALKLALHHQIPTDSATIQLFDYEGDSAWVDTDCWGIWQKMKVSGIHQQKEEEAAFGIGQQAQYEGLCMLGNHSALQLLGNTRLEADVYVGESGVQSAWIGNLGYEGDALVHGNQYENDEIQPIQIHECLLKIRTQLEELNEKSDSNMLIISSLSSVQGDVRMASEVLIQAGAKLENVQIYANRIEVESGFEGSVQLFANELIYVRENVNLKQPSTLFLYPQPEKVAQLWLSSHSQVEGAVFCDMKWVSNLNQPAVYVRLDEKSSVQGSVYVPRQLDLRGTVEGVVYTEEFVLKTASGSYRNHLLDAHIRPFSSDSRAYIPFLHPQTSLRCIEEIH